MPYSDRARFTHDERRSARGFVRVRTVRVRGGKELRIGYRRDGSSAVISVLRPKYSAKASRRDPMRTRQRAYAVGLRYPAGSRENADAMSLGAAHGVYDTHAERHSSPYHHVGSCDETCRRGLRPHAHRHNSTVR